MKLHTFVFFFTFCSSIAAFSLPYGLNGFKNSSNLPSIVQNSAEQCDKAKCMKKCNCCPGYSIRTSWFQGDECIKCNCGKNFGCNLNAKNKICLCPAGYSEQSGTCKADCKKNPCQNNGKCVVKNDDIVCNCKEPYMGELCEKVLDLCKEVTCYNEGKCNTNSGKCDCSGTGYTGEKCEELTNRQCEQLKQNCYTTSGKCTTVDSGQTIQCLCPEEQAYSETDGCKDLCKGVNCYNEGKCNMKYGKCDCSSTEYTGEKCEELTIGQCEQLKENCYASGGKCRTVDLGQTIECLCPPGQGYTETEGCIDLCKDVICYNGGKCQVKSSQCDCSSTGYTGEKCEEFTNVKCELLKENCYTSGGKCTTVDFGQTIECLCPPGQEYTKTEGCTDLYKDVKCYNKGKCHTKTCKCDCRRTGYAGEKYACKGDNDCSNGGKCKISEEGSLKICHCLKGTDGPKCENVIECETKDCGSEATCTYNIDEDLTFCKCNTEEMTFHDKDKKCKHVCKDDDDCSNGGKCKISEEGSLQICNCLKGTDGPKCENVKECKTKDCGSEATCTYNIDEESTFCKCNTEELTFDDKAKKCKHICKDDSDCSNGAKCKISEERSLHICHCLKGTEGPKCENVKECKAKDCGSEATCTYNIDEESTFCKCNTEEMTFDDKDKKCKQILDICKDDSDCSNGGKCKISKEGSLKICHCLKGTDGPKCENVKECKAKDCGSEATCTYNIDEESTFCKCNTEELTFDDKDKKCKQIQDICKDDDDCSNGAKCKISEERSLHICHCLKGTDGPKCENVKECKAKDCGSEATCTYNIDEESTFCKCNTEEMTFDDKDKKCKLSDGTCVTLKPKCEETGGSCISAKNKTIVCTCPTSTEYKDDIGCQVLDGTCSMLLPNCEETGGSCISAKNKHILCSCPTGTEYKDDIGCQVLEETCSTLLPNCEETGGSCISTKNKHILCSCPTGTEYKDDIGCQDKCSNVTCLNGGKCIIKGEKAACNCTDKYTGNFCETDLTSLDDSGDDIFISVFFKNRSLSTDSKLDFHFSRKETSNRTITELLLRLNSKSIARPPDDKCSLISCQNGGTCEVKNEKAACSCTDEYTGDYCEKSKCSLIKCQNGGNCQLYDGKAICICPDNYFGEYCENHECSLNKCKNGGKCEIKNGNAVCICPDRYTGNHCETDKCSLVPCKNGGRCDIVNGTARCICQDNYTGDSCETDKCSLIRCHNGGKCDVKNGEAVCMCNDEHIGDFCEIDKCSLIRCMNGGKCEIKNQKAVCVCNDKFTGDYCEKRIH